MSEVPENPSAKGRDTEFTWLGQTHFPDFFDGNQELARRATQPQGRPGESSVDDFVGYSPETPTASPLNDQLSDQAPHFLLEQYRQQAHANAQHQAQQQFQLDQQRQKLLHDQQVAVMKQQLELQKAQFQQSLQTLAVIAPSGVLPGGLTYDQFAETAGDPVAAAQFMAEVAKCQDIEARARRTAALSAARKQEIKEAARAAARRDGASESKYLAHWWDFQ